MDCSGFPPFNSWADDARVLTINLEERVLHPLFLGSYPFFFFFFSFSDDLQGGSVKNFYYHDESLG